MNQESAAQAHAYAVSRVQLAVCRVRSNRKKQKGRPSGEARSMQRDVERCPPHVEVNERFKLALMN
jgi:hypothetical protein